MVLVAQLVRAPDCGSGGRRFKSDQGPHKTNNPSPIGRGVICFVGSKDCFLSSREGPLKIPRSLRLRPSMGVALRSQPAGVVDFAEQNLGAWPKGHFMHPPPLLGRSDGWRHPRVACVLHRVACVLHRVASRCMRAASRCTSLAANPQLGAPTLVGILFREEHQYA